MATLFAPILKLGTGDETSILDNFQEPNNLNPYKVGDLVEFIYEEKVLKGSITHVIDNTKAIVKSHKDGNYAILVNRFLTTIPDWMQRNKEEVKTEVKTEVNAEVNTEVNTEVEVETNAEVEPESESEGFRPSKYQHAIVRAVEDNLQTAGILGGVGKNLLVEASAGCAKSTTLVQIAQILRGKKVKAAHCRFVVFGKKNQKDLEAKITEKCNSTWGGAVQTLHSLSFEILRNGKKAGSYSLSDHKYKNIAQKLGQLKRGLISGSLDTPDKDGNVVCLAEDYLDLLEKIRVYLVPLKSEDVQAYILSLDTFSGANLPEVELIADCAIKALKEGIKESEGSLDFTDMMWVLVQRADELRPLITKWASKLRFVGVDECQDLSLLQLEVLKMLNTPNNVFTFVGDRYQSIYAFRGSLPGMMDKIKEQFECQSLELPVNYRCGSSHLDFIKFLYPRINIKPGPDAIPGEIRCIEEEKLAQLLSDNMPTFGIARKNASLTKTAISLATQEISVFCKEDIGGKIFGFVSRAVSASKLPYDPQTFQKVLRSYGEKSQSTDMEDVEECCNLLFDIHHPATLPEWKVVLGKLFNNENATVELHSIHSGKGGEGERVLFLHPDTTPIVYKGQTSEEIQQEDNAIYIALSRCLAKREIPGSGTLWLVIRKTEVNGVVETQWPVWLPQRMRVFSSI